MTPSFSHTLTYLQAWLGASIRDERGQGMVEYGLILALIVLVAAGAAGAVATGVVNVFGNTAAQLP